MKTTLTIILISMLVFVALQTSVDKGARLLVCTMLVIIWMAIITHRYDPFR